MPATPARTYPSRIIAGGAHRLTEAEVPPGFGITRADGSGTSSHELIYEFEYQPLPVRYYKPDTPNVCPGLLCPAIRRGKAPFKFFGVRVPQSADHARCWLGKVLVMEVQALHLHRAEFITQEIDDYPRGDLAHQHGRQPSWTWHAWPPLLTEERPDRRPPVLVLMVLSPNDGIYIEVEGEDEAAKAHVYLVLRQYCDDAGSTWRPIPDPPSEISKIQNRETPNQPQLRQMIGLEVPAGLNVWLTGKMDNHQAAEQRLCHALSRAEASREIGTLEDNLLYCDELLGAFQEAAQVQLKIRLEWREAALVILDTLLRRHVEQMEALPIERALELTNQFRTFGVLEPVHYPPALKALQLLDRDLDDD